MTGAIGKVALLWRGDPEARNSLHPRNSRLEPVFEALAARHIYAEPAVYSDDWVSEVRSELSALDGVLVWVDPISDGLNRTKLDAMLRDVASQGVWVSTHPDVILKMGVKEVLYRTPPPEGPDSPAAQPGPRIMYSKSAPEFQRLRTLMESEWTPQMTAALQIRSEELPLIWDADFLYGPKTRSGDDTYVLCEINVSSVLPIPDQAPEEIAHSVENRLRSR